MKCICGKRIWFFQKKMVVNQPSGTATVHYNCGAQHFLQTLINEYESIQKQLKELKKAPV